MILSGVWVELEEGLGLGRLGGRGGSSSRLGCLLSCHWLGWTSHLHHLQVLDLVRVQLLHLLQLCNLPVTDAVEHGLEGLGLEHHVLDEVNIKVVQVHCRIDSANLVCSSSTSYSRAHISLMAFFTTLPKFDFSSARGINSGFISTRMVCTIFLMSSEMLKWNLSILLSTRAHSSRSSMMWSPILAGEIESPVTQ